MCHGVAVLYIIISYIFFSALFSHTFFFNDTATTEIYTLSLHDALPIYVRSIDRCTVNLDKPEVAPGHSFACGARDRKSTRLNSSHVSISYAVFCLKKKKKIKATLLRNIPTPENLQRLALRSCRPANTSS